MKKVTIKGLTDCTIAFTKINMILRGNSNNLELYPTSIAKGVEIKTPEQERELEVLQKAKIIEVIVEEEQKVVVPETKPVEEKKSDDKRKIKKVGKLPVMTSPDGKPLTMKVDDVEEPSTLSDFDPRNVEDSKKVDESVKAAEKISDQENEPPLVIDEKSLDASERMGNEVVISTGKDKIKKSNMKRSCVQGDDEAKKADPFIDKDEKKEDKKTEEAFVEDKKDDDKSDAFIEV